MEIKKIKEKIEFLDVEAQGCLNDCVEYTDRPITVPAPAIYVCNSTTKRTAHKSTKY